jgi:predicted N-acetyltransferase YhbS
MAQRMVASVARRSASAAAPSIIVPPRRKPAARFSASSAPPPGLRLLAARTGDHPRIHDLLLSVFHGPALQEFHAQIDEPGYAATDRLIVKDAEEIAAHLRLARQSIQLGSAAAQVVRFMDLATAPEYRSRGLASALLAAGERAARERGATIALTRTRAPALFARHGWSPCGRHVFSTAASRAVLAELSASAALRSSRAAGSAVLFEPRTEPIVVRPLRRIELEAVRQIYARHQAGRFGWPIRSADYWEWLLARQACDRVFVAARGPEPGTICELLASIVGYAFVRQTRIVELVTVPDSLEVARHLAARVCADACEHHDWHLRCDLESGHPLHDLLRQAGGEVTHCRELGGDVFMAKLLDPLAVLRQLAPELLQRARAARLALPLEIGLELRSPDDSFFSKRAGIVERFVVQLSRRGAKVATGGPSRHFLALRSSDLTPLLLGDVAASHLHAAGRLHPSSAAARNLATTLFPTTGWWRPALDDLLA